MATLQQVLDPAANSEVLTPSRLVILGSTVGESWTKAFLIRAITRASDNLRLKSRVENIVSLMDNDDEAAHAGNLPSSRSRQSRPGRCSRSTFVL
jgi:hypothetical protein